MRVRTLDPMTGRVISPLTAAALCVRPRGQMTARQVANVDVLKAASAEFTAMRRLAMRFRDPMRRWSRPAISGAARVATTHSGGDHARRS